MKKVYEKPGMYVENFALSQSIAAGGCAAVQAGIGRPGTMADRTCGWDMGNYVVWTQNNTNCTKKRKKHKPFQGICYNNPNGNLSIFSYS